MGSDGIAISSDGPELGTTVSGAVGALDSVHTAALADQSLDDREVGATVINEGDKGGASDGLESDGAGYIYSTNYEHNSILCRSPNVGEWETVAHDPRLLWPDTLSLAGDGYLYVTANQLHCQTCFHKGQNSRRKPYTLFRIRIDAQPVLLRLMQNER